jgi:hypothetical protein
MDVRVVLGWDEATAVKILNTFALIPDDDTIEDTDLYMTSDAGIAIINQNLERLNEKFGTVMHWTVYHDSHYILRWRDEFAKTVGDPQEPPTGKYYLDASVGELAINKLKNEFGDFSEPYMILVLDASEYYNHHVYDASSDEASSDLG